MADETEPDFFALITPDIVQQVYADEQDFVDKAVERWRKTGDNWFRKATEWIPYIDFLMTEQEASPATATDDVDRVGRTLAAIRRIEAGTGFTLDAQTKANITSDFNDMYNGN